MEKLDLRKQYKHLCGPSARAASLVDVPPLQFAMIDGVIEPGSSPGDSPSFSQAVEALYSASYTLKFASKLRPEDPVDYTVMPLEGLWWVEGRELDLARPEGWLWTAMIMQPDHITRAMFQEALDRSRANKPSPAIDKVRFETFHEGLSVQLMHIGAYAEEPASLAKMEAWARDNGYAFRGKHHEIYLGDPRRSAPEKLKTVLRHPVR